MRDRRRLIPTVLSGGGFTLLTNLMSYWNLNETTGNRVDHNGARALVPTGTIGYDTGHLGNCATFPGGATDYLYSGVDATLTAINWALGFSIVGWVYFPGGWAANCSILAKEVNNTYDWALYCATPGQPRFAINDSVTGFSTASASSTVAADTWAFVAGRYNPSTKKAEVSIDNAWGVNGNALTNVPINAQNRLMVGRYVTAYGREWVDELRLYSRYLSNAEITRLYNGETV